MSFCGFLPLILFADFVEETCTAISVLEEPLDAEGMGNQGSVNLHLACVHTSNIKQQSEVASTAVHRHGNWGDAAFWF